MRTGVMGISDSLVIKLVLSLGLFSILVGSWPAEGPTRTATVALQVAADSFPHADHEGLFPLCAGCHQAAAGDGTGAMYPTLASCVGCHDGVELTRVEWSPPSDDPSLLSFDHPDHAGALRDDGEEAASCRACHGGDPDRRMDVEALDAGRCLDCHEGAPEDHLGGTACETCHVTAAASRLSGAALVSLPIPPDHLSGSFIRLDHAETARVGTGACATCHVQQRCEACHVDSERPAIRAIPTAFPGVTVPDAVAHYPVPTAHADRSFLGEHGRGLAESDARAECATCHTQDDCASCHVELTTFLAAMPMRGAVTAPGVGLQRAAPDSHLSPFFMTGHSTLAAAAPGSCATCHEPPSCVSCHDAAGPTVFHPENFALRHASAAFGGTSECSACHDAERFCRDCHTQAGLGSSGRLGSDYHDAEPAWLLRHGQAARQGLETCASCHRQNDCLQCHSQRGAFRISPHAPNFDARRAWDRNPRICAACHLRSPFGNIQ